MNILKVWLLPLATITAFLGLLMGGIPYSAGYGWSKIPLGSMMWTLWAQPDWQHAMFVPLISLFLVFVQQKKIRQTPIRGSNWAAGWILLGIFIYCIGLKAETQYFGFVAIQILLAGLILWFWGTKVFSMVSFAWVFLLFMWPMPFLDGMMALPLRLVMSHSSSTLLNLLGTPCIQSGTAVLSAPDPAAGLKLGGKFQVDIADPCSGLHSLFALMMVSTLAGYMSVKSIAARWLIFLTSIPLAIMGNVVRILLLVWATEHFGADFALGTADDPSWFHLGCGYAVYLVALILLIGLITLLNSRWAQRTLEKFHHPSAPDHGRSPNLTAAAVTIHSVD